MWTTGGILSTILLFPKLCSCLQSDGDHQDTKWYKLQGTETENLRLTCSAMSHAFRVMLTVWGCPLAMFLWSTSMLYGSLVPPRLYRICRYPSERNVKSTLRYFDLYSTVISPSFIFTENCYTFTLKLLSELVSAVGEELVFEIMKLLGWKLYNLEVWQRSALQNRRVCKQFQIANQTNRNYVLNNIDDSYKFAHIK